VIPAFAELVAGEEVSQRQVAPATPDERIADELQRAVNELRNVRSVLER
jgi:hypothetical protein